MNDGNTLINEESVNYAESKKLSNSILFFNYHEFLISDFKESDKENLSLIGNHFPNNYVSDNSDVYASTRIIRIPRVYDINKYTDVIPQFSPYTPGDEPAALKSDDIEKFIPVGEFEENNFGTTSITPLTPGLISKDDFDEIITAINKLLFEAFNPHSFYNLLDNVFNFVTGELYSKVVNKYIIENHSKKKLYELEGYIEKDINPKFMIKDPLFRIISPRRNGYLSLDIQIPKTVLGKRSQMS